MEHVLNWFLGPPSRAVVTITWAMLITVWIMRGFSWPLLFVTIALAAISIPVIVVWVISSAGS